MSEEDFNHVEYMVEQFIMKLEAELGYYEFDTLDLNDKVLNLVTNHIK